MARPRFMCNDKKYIEDAAGLTKQIPTLVPWLNSK